MSSSARATRTWEHAYCLACTPLHRVDWDTGEGIVYKNDAGEVVPAPDDDVDEETRLRTAFSRRRAFCRPGGHLLPARDSILVGYFGQVWAGKDSMILSAVHEATHGALSVHGIRLSQEADDSPRWAETASTWIRENTWEQAPTQASAAERYVPVELSAHVGDGRERTRRSVMLFNTSGEDFWHEPASQTGMLDGERERSVRERFPFVPELDVLVIAVPPRCLDIPDAAPPLPAEAQQSGVRTSTGIDQIADFLHDADRARPFAEERARRRTVVLALTKSDRYADVPAFPPRLLQRRARGESLRDALADEQPLLARFLVEHGGGGILDAARRLADTVYLTAVSGTGPDDPSRVVAAPPHLSDRGRSLDPLHIAFLRYGIGSYA